MKTGERIKTIRKSQGITAETRETLHISSEFHEPYRKWII